jgi:O-methyltransferase domain
VGVGFAGYPKPSKKDGVKWYDVGVRCAACGVRTAAPNDGARCECHGVVDLCDQRHVPLPAGAIMLVPAGSAAQLRSSGSKDSLQIFLEPGLVARVAAEGFGLDPARVAVPPLDGLDRPHLRAAMWAVDAELTVGGAGGRLAAESLANVLAVHLIRHVLAPRRAARGRGGGDAYLMKHIIHDWSDDQATTILRNCRTGVNTGGKLLLFEMVVAPGDAADLVKLIDLDMLVNLTGRERTEAEFRQLLSGAGWRLTRVLPTKSPTQIVEAEPA